MDMHRARGSLGNVAVNAQASVQSLLIRLRATHARLFAPDIASPVNDTGPARPAGPSDQARPSAKGEPLSPSPAQAWQVGFDAFRRGETAPADPDAAEGWHWAENAASSRLPLD